MPSINWSEVFAHPFASVKILLLATARSLRPIFLSIVAPSSIQPLGLRNSLARAWMGTIFVNSAAIFYSEPSQHGVQKIELPGIDGDLYIVPTTKEVELKDADAVVIWCHGGGLIAGHPLQYLKSYRRWVKVSEVLGKKTIFVPVRYPLSISKKWPAQREAMIAVYSWILSRGVNPSRIVFAGDSAGGDLVALSLLYLRDNAPDLPMPSCAVLQSPWLDWTGSKTISSPNWSSDFMLEYDASTPIMNQMLRPNGSEADTPEISALLVESLGGLPPQLVMYSSTEILASDSERWVERCRKEGGDIVEFVLKGELHTFAVGSPICGCEVERNSDEVFLNYLFRQTSKT